MKKEYEADDPQFLERLMKMYVCNFVKPLISNVKDRHTSRYITDAMKKYAGNKTHQNYTNTYTSYGK